MQWFVTACIGLKRHHAKVLVTLCKGLRDISKGSIGTIQRLKRHAKFKDTVCKGSRGIMQHFKRHCAKVQ